MQPEIHPTEAAFAAAAPATSLPAQRRKGVLRASTVDLGVARLAAATFLAGIEALEAMGREHLAAVASAPVGAAFGAGAGTGTHRRERRQPRALAAQAGASSVVAAVGSPPARSSSCRVPPSTSRRSTATS